MLHWVIVERDGKKHYLEMPHRLYYEFAVRSFSRYQAISKQLKSIDPGSQPDEAALYERRQAMNSVAIFSALSLEAYINYYAVRYEIPFHKDTDRLSTSQKWNIYTNWKAKKSVKEQTIANIRKIFKLRNTLVHAKPELGEMGGDSAPEGKSGQAQIESTGLGELIIDLNSIYEDTFSIDPDESAEYERESWLYVLRKIS